MIVFRNPGLIDMPAVTTMGVSVKNPGSFGYFGTGLKYAIATILRDGGSIDIWRGTQRHAFRSRKKEIRGEPFDIVTMNGKALGFTTALGRNWEPWMILRELGCNAQDEGGEFYQVADDPVEGCPNYEDSTLVEVRWDKLDEVYTQRDQIFTSGEPLWELPGVLKVFPGPSDHLFYRGVRVHKLQKPSFFKYDLQEAQTLTEDRGLAYYWTADSTICKAWLHCEDVDLVGQAVCTGPNFYEAKMGFGDHSDIPLTRAFLDAVLSARDRRDGKLSGSARARVMSDMRKQSDDTVGYTSYRGRQDVFSQVMDELDDLGLSMRERDVVVVEELPGDILSMVEHGRVYVVRSMLRMGARVIADQMARRIVELDCLDMDDAINLLLPLLLNQKRLTSQKDLEGETTEVVEVLKDMMGMPL